ncbi:hypothetical protein THITH_10930 [Thioalkalivibrio paradoxus ARh 1]|uniref:Uncharacterized protein n=1 Tax=Thioalkalivibrio paradoxus ARh 1 TaxID=713585 RepID=W0DNM0_9GAMM|nr:hypothetical protein THITH_10930 [Thioalkalivibrio paradoxus ARh 1]
MRIDRQGEARDAGVDLRHQSGHGRVFCGACLDRTLADMMLAGAGRPDSGAVAW